ncbi:MAG: rhodanese-like domain-containing protein [Pseudomonadota bacterium]
MAHDSEIAHASPAAVWSALSENSAARLVDVRTRAEWAYVGLPDLSALGAEPILLEWQRFPDMTVAPDFADALASACPDAATPLYFLCRSGVRSLAAARALRDRGYPHVFNITDGFEGPPDGEGHRGTVAGWKADGLPWRQS